jgi:hypothetical protein
VLRTLPSRTRRRVPFRVRHRVAAVLVLLLVLGAIGGAAVWLVPRTHHGTGHPPQRVLGTKHLAAVSLCGGCAHGFNPLNQPTDEHPNASLAIDNLPNTYWNTQSYNNANLNKAGTGLYVDANDNGHGIVARLLRITTATPGFTVTIYGRNGAPPLRWPDAGWTVLSAPTKVAGTQDIRLSGNVPYRYFLVWITNLGGHDSLAIDEVTLYVYS